ncbi:MAG: Rv1733c family protein [Trebonia sp.]
MFKKGGRPGHGWLRRGSWLRRAIRGTRPDRNPLRRRSDRVEVYVLAGSLAVAIAVTPFAAHLAGEAGHAAAQNAERNELASSHEVKAVVLQSVGGTPSDYSFDSVYPAEVRWSSPGGHDRTGQVAMPAGTRKGATVDVWVDTAGQLTSPPLNAGQVAGQADLASAGAIAGIALLYLCESVLVRQLATRRRLAAWDAEWAVTGPAWNRQRW